MPLYISQGILKPSRPRVLVTKGSIGSTDSTSWSKGCVDIMVVAGGIKTSWSKGCVDIMVVAGGIKTSWSKGCVDIMVVAGGINLYV
jgi:hypothetical protein